MPSDNVQHDPQHGSLVTFPKEENLSFPLPPINVQAGHHSLRLKKNERKIVESHSTKYHPSLRVLSQIRTTITGDHS